MEVRETDINIVSEGTTIEGSVTFDKVARVFGVLKGDVKTRAGSLLVLGETGVIEGNVHADSLMIDGFVKGDIVADTRVTVSRTGRVSGNIRTPSLVVEFGAYVEGKCSMEGVASKGAPHKGASVTAD
ncbi:MAG TPA: polymer-forming cytoskeletal protein, partial [Bdellovibrionota bacterium]|nr:polymer-forming cytoskeletal protein [Bdellovibrionota bacterium]